MRTDAQNKLTQINNAHEQYLKLEDDKKQAEYNSRLYKTIADLLGKNGLQLHTYIARC